MLPQTNRTVSMIASRERTPAPSASHNVSRETTVEAFLLLTLEPTRGLEPRTFRLQDSFSALTMTATSDFTVYSDCFCGYSGVSGPEFVSQVVSRRHRRCDLRIDPIGLHGTARSAPRTVSGRRVHSISNFLSLLAVRVARDERQEIVQRHGGITPGAALCIAVECAAVISEPGYSTADPERSTA
jgi:hypothetical protein